MAGIEFIRDLAVVLGVAGLVGWLCQRIGLSLVVGYLAAGAIVGPYTPPFQLVSNLDRVQVLAQVGLVFLIFSIGLDLSLARLKRLGVPVILATGVGAVLVFNGCQLFASVAGWPRTHGLFLAAMLMVSSSAIISKVLREINASHRRDSQLALGITVMEDAVAVAMLTVLATVTQFGGTQTPALPKILGGLTAFMVLLALSALFFVPRLLLRLTQAGRVELRTIIVIALLFFLAWLAQIAGYSLALGAFLLGVVVASTPQKLEMERVFEGLRDMFGAVFFVAMGMLVDFRLLLSAWPLVLGVTLFALVCRSLATSTGLVLAGHETRESVRAGLALTPLGEFSFIAAQMGVTAGALPSHFFPVAVGASLLTSLTAPVVIRRSDRISGWVDKHLPLMLREWIAFYHGWLELMVRRRERSVLWKLTSKRLVQVAVEMIVVSGLMIFSRPAFDWVHSALGDKWLFMRGTSVLFWTVFVIVLLLPLVALWRNLGALSMIAAEWVTLESPRRETLQPLLERALRGVASVLLVIWLLSLMPFGGPAGIALILVFVVIMLRAGLVWRRLIFWQSRLEIELRTQLQAAVGGTEKKELKQLLDSQQDQWQLQAEEYTLPDFSSSAGRRIGELALRTRFGCSIASIDRQGLVIVNPGADVVLYPNDKLLLLGNEEQVMAAIGFLGEARTEDAAHEIEEFSLETMQVPPGSPLAGRPLAELDLFRRAGVQVAGIQKGSKRVLTPGGAERIEAGDLLLVLGTPKRVAEFESLLGSEKETRSRQEPAALGD